MTGRPCGQVVGEEVRSRRSISQRIFSAASGVLTLMAARQASEAAIALAESGARRAALLRVHRLQDFRQHVARLARRQIGGHGRIATVRPDRRISPKP